MWVYSERGRGTTFQSHLPRADGRPAPVRESAPSGRILGGSETVLVAEDDARVRLLVTDGGGSRARSCHR